MLILFTSLERKGTLDLKLSTVKLLEPFFSVFLFNQEDPIDPLFQGISGQDRQQHGYKNYTVKHRQQQNTCKIKKNKNKIQLK